MNILITGGAGFIGSAVIRLIIQNTSHRVLNIDKLTYAGNLDSLLSVYKSERYRFIKGDICDDKLLVFGNLPYNISTEILCKWIINLDDKKNPTSEIKEPVESKKDSTEIDKK